MQSAFATDLAPRRDALLSEVATLLRPDSGTADLDAATLLTATSILLRETATEVVALPTHVPVADAIARLGARAGLRAATLAFLRTVLALYPMLGQAEWPGLLRRVRVRGAPGVESCAPHAPHRCTRFRARGRRPTPSSLPMAVAWARPKISA